MGYIEDFIGDGANDRPISRIEAATIAIDGSIKLLKSLLNETMKDGDLIDKALLFAHIDLVHKIYLEVVADRVSKGE